MSQTAGERFEHLVEIMRTLRSEQGCAWDRQQTVQSLRPFVLSETYELLDALDREDYEEMKGELGDFLFEAVFLAQICEDDGRFSIADAIAAVADKLVRRHPHVFNPDGTPLRQSADGAATSLTPKEVKGQWEEIKARERKDAGDAKRTTLSGIPRSMPSLLRAYELSTRAATVGFEWPTASDVMDKVEEEVRELRDAVTTLGPKSAEAEEELGDLLFALTNVARKLGIEPEAALRVANDKFQQRFEDIERQARDAGQTLPELTLEEMEALWQRAKRNTKEARDAKGQRP
jgi:MazG family protein